MKIALALLVVALSTIWNGFVFSKLWSWFIAAAFSLPTLGLAQSIGLMVTVRMVTYTQTAGLARDKTKTPDERLTEAIALTIMTPAFCLLLGWLIKSCI